ncbi:glycoside hydrolase family 172 protein [Candidatus Hydrogenedentota bacterium]
MDINLDNIFRKREAESRSLSAENFRGEKGKGGMATPETSFHQRCANAARELGQGWKMSPCIVLDPGETVEIMDNEGPGVIRHVWVTLDPKFYRDIIIRMYWDGDETPSVECPIGDFFCCSWKDRQNILAIPVNVNPKGGMNMFLPMPFKKHGRITVTNDSPEECDHFFYTINYTLEEVDPDALYFHAQWRRTNPVEYGQDYLMVDGIKGQGQYVGTFMSWQQNSATWWGEGEIKMFIDGDDEFPTICGTGTEDYFGGAWGFGDDFTAPYLGFLQVAGKSGQAGTRMILYRFHVHDPVFFKSDLRVTMQDLGWRSGTRFCPLQDDIASVVYWYQTLPHAPFPEIPDRDAREIV